MRDFSTVSKKKTCGNNNERTHGCQMCLQDMLCLLNESSVSLSRLSSGSGSPDHNSSMASVSICTAQHFDSIYYFVFYLPLICLIGVWVQARALVVPRCTRGEGNLITVVNACGTEAVATPLHDTDLTYFLLGSVPVGS